MASLNENAVAVLASATVHLKNGDGKSTVYTVPPGKAMIPIMAIIHSPTDSLADGTDFDIGSGANADTWKQTNDLSAMVNTTDYKVITDLQKYTMEVAGAEFGIKPVTGATADADATMVLLGLLI
jgi:hypothetical protein